MLSVECCIIFYFERSNKDRDRRGCETEPNLLPTIAKVNMIFEQEFVSPLLSFARRLLP